MASRGSNSSTVSADGWVPCCGIMPVSTPPAPEAPLSPELPTQPAPRRPSLNWFLDTLLQSPTAFSRPRALAWGLTLLLLVYVWVVPRGFDLSTRLLGHPRSDLSKHYWNLWWFIQSYAGPAFGSLHTHWLNAPEGLWLYPIEPLNGLLARVLVPLVGLPVATNVIALLQLWGGVVGFYLLAQHLTQKRLPALMAALTYALGSYGTWTVYVGVGELSTIGLPPLALYAAFKALEKPTMLRLLGVFSAVFLTGYACWYYALFSGMLMGLLLFSEAPRSVFIRKTPLAWGGTTVMVALGFLALLPLISGFHHSYGVSEHSTEPLQMFIRQRLSRAPHDPFFTRLDLTQLVLGGPQVLAQAMQVPYSGGRFLGISLTGLGVLGMLLSLRKAWPWALGAGLTLLLGLGSQLVLNGHERPGQLPFHVFNLVLERYAQPMNFPARFMQPLTLSMCVLMALALARVSLWWERVPVDVEAPQRPPLPRLLALTPVLLLGFLPLAELRMRGDVPLPLPGLTLPAWKGAQALQSDPTPGAVLELPQLFLQTNREGYDSVLQMQVVHGRPTAHLPLDRIDQLVKRSSETLRQNPLLASLALASGLPEVGNFDCCPAGPLGTEADEQIQQARQALLNQGFGFVLISWRGYSDGNRSHTIRLAEHWLGPAIYEGPSQHVFRLTPSQKAP